MLDKVKEKLEDIIYGFEHEKQYPSFSNFHDENIKAKEALTELNTFIESNGWQDIKSAPTEDYSRVDLFTEKGSRFTDSVLRSGEWCNTFCGISNTPIESFGHVITHFKPITPLPSIKSIKV